jgi:hypothetical protein
MGVNCVKQFCVNILEGGTPYEVEVWYDGAGEQYFKGGWSQFVDDHGIQRGFFMTFNFHVGTSSLT